MKTDSFFHRLFRDFPEAFFALIGENQKKAKQYKFTSVEVKETAFRFDGIFQPKLKRDHFYFVEVQFQKRPRFYPRLFAEIYLYLAQHNIPNDWRAVVIFPKRAIDPGIHRHYRELFESGRLLCIYLEDLPQTEREQFPTNILEIIAASESQVLSTVKKITKQLPKHIRSVPKQERIIDLLVTLLMRKFPRITRKEVLQMMTPFLSDIKKSRAYQEIAAEGRLEKTREIAKTMLKKKMAPKLIEEITGLSAREIRALNKEFAARKN